ncbi:MULTISPECIES: acyltransferase family protein [unclassified Enterococcus]|uniref:acyltransferase family protein n=1 Tax=unclassified Enterococcus TaxID=2608891 RepID=UPI0015530529|nr:MULTISPECIES: acyltransferase family protein [unclassified Enterococcus]MBS7577284.1 acyltransferase [Enterococcus sp. MMGLQ5-2]MBS7584623.1 acyltransferase [Enterococcus sp. MMGLQ5-1]NPD12478.1 acyltransferase [Enterococcus sp. MMGLQ5-1]NPD37118.1 acyltransferase [Enterococcus sp. MMGLQ5-2]
MASKHQRIFYLDLIRAIAVLLIVLCHYNANFIGYNGPAQLEKIVFFEYPFGIYIGDLGVGLFMLISGAAMWHVYGGRKLNYFKFIKKRLLSILPMFYIAYLSAFLFQFWLNRGFTAAGVSLKYFISTILGFDSLFATLGLPNFMLVGEWFIGMIIVIYLLFPIIKWLVASSSLFSLAIAVIIEIIVNIPVQTVSTNWHFLQLTIGYVPIFIAGMLIQKHIENFKRLWLLIPSLTILVLNSFIDQTIINSKIQMIYISIACFFIAILVAKYVNQTLCRNVVNLICKYSYAIFLTHHYITNQLVKHFDIQIISIKQSYILFFMILPVIFFCSWALYKLNISLFQLFKKQTG